MGFDMIQELERVKQEYEKLNMRIGIHTVNIIY